VAIGNVHKNHSSNRSSTTASVVSGKGVLGKCDRTTLPSATQGKGNQPTLRSATHGNGDQPTVPSTTHEILQILRQQAAWGGGHAAIGVGTYFVSCLTFFGFELKLLYTDATFIW